MKRLLVAVLVLAALFGHVLALEAGVSDPSAHEAIITLQGTTVMYVGKVNELSVERLLAIVSGKTVTELIISTSGGEVDAGMRMGEWVYDNQIDVVVDGMCMSSGANYVFTAGRRKTIRENSIVAWHGSMISETSDEEIRTAVIEGYEQLPEAARAEIDLDDLIGQSIRQAREYIATNRAKQAQFFEKIGVDEYVCRVGNEEYGAEDFFCLTVEDMARFGIRNVEAPTDYAETDLSPYRKKSVEFIHLK
ncbi:MAG: hypothetical protein GX354_10240 [Firmicutes bacterium]|jgi:hypothetical protein|nr:hypothetical protein [Bacillota bacterium]